MWWRLIKLMCHRSSFPTPWRRGGFCQSWMCQTPYSQFDYVWEWASAVSQERYCTVEKQTLYCIVSACSHFSTYVHSKYCPLPSREWCKHKGCTTQISGVRDFPIFHRNPTVRFSLSSKFANQERLPCGNTFGSWLMCGISQDPKCCHMAWIAESSKHIKYKNCLLNYYGIFNM